MGGSGSGGHNYKGRLVAEAALRLDIRRLRKQGCLTPGWDGQIEWQFQDGSKPSVGFRSEVHAIYLVYTWRDPHNGQQYSVEGRIALEWSPCRFGGWRPYFLCRGCQKTVEVLFSRGGRFQCRACARVAYGCQNEGIMARAQRRQRKILLRFGRSDLVSSFIAVKPKGMWRRTYERLVASVLAAEDDINAVFFSSAARLLRRVQGR